MITYVKGDATCPQTKGPKVIAHVCNDIGGWGRGFVLAISARWGAPETRYRQWHRLRQTTPELHNEEAGSLLLTTGDFVLGEAQLVQVLPDTYVANMIAQSGMRTGSKGPPIRYQALEVALNKVMGFSTRLDASVHMPRIGCGLAGGTWDRVGPIIERVMVDLPVYVYDM